MPDTDPVRAAHTIDNLSGMKRKILDRIVRGDLSNWLNSQTVISRRPGKEPVARNFQVQLGEHSHRCQLGSLLFR
jgi:hypothetical protein